MATSRADLAGKLYNTWNMLIFLLFSVFTIFLSIMGLKYVAEPDWGIFNEKPTIVERSPFVTLCYILFVAIIFCVIAMASKRSKISFARKYLFPLVTIMAHLIMGIAWIRSNTYPTVSDQKIVCDAAMALENGIAIGSADYFIRYPFNEGIVYAIRFAMKVTGIVDPIAWRYVNLFALIAIDIVFMLLLRDFFEDDHDREVVTNVISVMLLLFVPIVLYTSFVYGTLVSMALVFWAFWGVVRLLKTEKWFYGLLPVLFLPIANRIYSGTMIATIAVIITLLVELLKAGREKRIKLVTIFAAIVIFYFLSELLIQHFFFIETGIRNGEGGYDYSTAGHIYMGIAAEDCVAGPGSYSDIVDYIYETHREDSESYFREQNRAIVKDYLSGERDISFFSQKTKYQWLDPWFGGITMTCYPGGKFEVDKDFYSFLFGPIPKLAYKYWLRNFMPFVYVMALIGVISWFKRTSFNVNILLALYFVGGFTFQLFWESKSRYCMPYFVSLLPLATLGIISMIQLLCRRFATIRKMFGE